MTKDGHFAPSLLSFKKNKLKPEFGQPFRHQLRVGWHRE